MSWKYEVSTDNTGKFYRNAVAFATEAEARSAGQAKFQAWTLVREYRVFESDEPANYRWDARQGLIALPETERSDNG